MPSSKILNMEMIVKFPLLRMAAHLWVRSLLVVGLVGAAPAFAVCTTLIKGPIAMNVTSCAAIVPENAFAAREAKYSFIHDLPPDNRKAFLDTYRGNLVKGVVTNSQAVRSGISEEKGALQGETIAALIPGNATTCQAVSGKSIEVQVAETCCDGGGSSPCLLNTPYILSNVKVSEGKGAVANGAQPRSAEVAAVFAKAKKAVQGGDLKGATALLEQLRGKNELDLIGQYQLAALYREEDKCPLALPILEGIHQKFLAKDYWTDTESAVRRGNYLYARCLAMEGKSSEAVLALQSFLVEPSRYEKELRDSLVHRDFGGIHTSKSFTKYKASVDQALRKASAEPSDH